MVEQSDAIVIGSGMAGLTVACLLAKDHNHINVLEQNWLPGGCSSSYPRKNYIFESGATTLVGLDPDMPLQYLLKQTGIRINPWQLDIPMKVYLKNGKVITRYQDLNQWIEEAERVFGKSGQRPFWEYCFNIAQLVWQTSLQQKVFPPSSLRDLIYAAQHFRPKQLSFATQAFRSMKDLLKKYKLLENKDFVEFVDEQLLITAQNYHPEVNVLFGATALCYTNFGNFYMPGGLLNMVKPMVEFIESQGSSVHLRCPVTSIVREGNSYLVQTNYRNQKKTFKAKTVISSIPVNNTLEILEDEKLPRRFAKRTLQSEQLNSAFQMGFVAKRKKDFDCLHHQIHLKSPLPFSNSNSIFLSLSHPKDYERCGPDEVVGSISTHVPDPQHRLIQNKEEIESAVFHALEDEGLFQREDIIYFHSSTPGSWEKWTSRKWGFVGGYPQYMHTKPWDMLDSRLDHKGLYICGDSTYPGQGIPGACLSGIVAYEKIKLDKRTQHN